MKPLSEFHKRHPSKDGFRNECKNCRCAWQQKYSKTDRGRFAQRKADKIRNKKFPLRRAARSALFKAVLNGQISPKPCVICGGKAEAHHPDYSNVLDIIWLCPSHHKKL